MILPESQLTQTSFQKTQKLMVTEVKKIELSSNNWYCLKTFYPSISG